MKPPFKVYKVRKDTWQQTLQRLVDMGCRWPWTAPFNPDTIHKHTNNLLVNADGIISIGTSDRADIPKWEPPEENYYAIIDRSLIKFHTAVNYLKKKGYRFEGMLPDSSNVGRIYTSPLATIHYDKRTTEGLNTEGKINIFREGLNTEEKSKLKYKGNIENFPEEIVEKMLEYQVAQENKRDVSVFEDSRFAGRSRRGFCWDITPEGTEFWREVIMNRNFDLFFNSKSIKDGREQILQTTNQPGEQPGTGRPICRRQCKTASGSRPVGRKATNFREKERVAKGQIRSKGLFVNQYRRAASSAY